MADNKPNIHLTSTEFTDTLMRLYPGLEMRVTMDDPRPGVWSYYFASAHRDKKLEFSIDGDLTDQVMEWKEGGEVRNMVNKFYQKHKSVADELHRKEHYEQN